MTYIISCALYFISETIQPKELQKPREDKQNFMTQTNLVAFLDLKDTVVDMSHGTIKDNGDVLYDYIVDITAVEIM